MVEYYNDEKDIILVFMSNNFEVSAFEKTSLQELLTEHMVNQSVKE
jgi:hypothetical protein